jgi:hypothetical protein
MIQNALEVCICCLRKNVLKYCMRRTEHASASFVPQTFSVQYFCSGVAGIPSGMHPLLTAFNSSSYYKIAGKCNNPPTQFLKQCCGICS